MLEGLTGRRLLIVLEGKPLDAATRRVLEGAGVDFAVAGGDRVKALLQECRFDGVVIDIDVEAGIAISLVERLEEIGIPFLFARNEPGQVGMGRYSGYRLCSDIDEMEAISDGLRMSAPH